MPVEIDYLVVGAGVAGCTLGYLLRQAGASVMLVDLRDLAKKDKLCGGVLSVGALQLLRGVYGAGALEELGLFWPEYHVSRFGDHQLTRAVEYATVSRKVLDTWLLERYLSTGGIVHDRLRVDAIDAQEHLMTLADLRTRKGVRLSYGTLVGADGATSAVRRLLAGRRQRTIVSVEGYVPRAGADVIFCYRPARVGYCWYIPTNNEANVGCCCYDAGARTCREWLAEFCSEMGLDPTDVRGAPIPTGDDVLLSAADGVWLAGDAAGLITPSVSGGIHYALASAIALARSLGGGTPYEKIMADGVERIRSEAAAVTSSYRLRLLAIARKGSPV